ncbi:hypothetical protein KY084_16175 [Stakelama sp. CBK3Z-3]|uniref:Uncharacterized protein n=1 Tax=Stakelama flava TaxID=2860338 RepID=A0ABS6XSG6_9SPHN|nr:hypothetical protein [Stakelama flava]
MMREKRRWNSARSGFIGSRQRICLQTFEALRTHLVNDATELLNLLTEPFELAPGDAVMLRVARLDAGFLELIEQRPVAANIARPDIGEAAIDALGLRTREAEIMHMGRIESADQQHAVIQAFAGLVQLEGGVVGAALDTVEFVIVEILLRQCRHRRFCVIVSI